MVDLQALSLVSREKDVKLLGTRRTHHGSLAKPFVCAEIMLRHNENLYKSEHFRFIVLGVRTIFLPGPTSTGTGLSKSRGLYMTIYPNIRIKKQTDPFHIIGNSYQLLQPYKAKSHTWCFMKCFINFKNCCVL